ncbi:MAG: hypothetical protein MUP09_01180 [Thiovulaceae bacterium]|nr:hypothetical protein [Sulfurimonadaceae bacterium]
MQRALCCTAGSTVLRANTPFAVEAEFASSSAVSGASRSISSMTIMQPRLQQILLESGG